jgi:GTP-binding protein
METEDGGLWRFIDTAGVMRRANMKDGPEFLAVNRTLKAANRADITLLCLDATMIADSRIFGTSGIWRPSKADRYIARQLEERGCAVVICLTKWDAVPNKDNRTLAQYVEAIRGNLCGVGQWAEVVACSAKTGQRLGKVIEVMAKTLKSHRARVDTNTLNEVIRDALLWKLPAARSYARKQGRIYYAVQSSTEPPTIVIFCNNPLLFKPQYKVYLENKLRQDLGWFGTPLQLEWRKRSQRKASAKSAMEEYLGPRLLETPAEAFR